MDYLTFMMNKVKKSFNQNEESFELPELLGNSKLFILIEWGIIKKCKNIGQN